MNKISLKIGSKVYFENKQYEISKQISTKEILAKEVDFPYEFKVLKIQYLKSEPLKTQKVDISLYSKEEWSEANKKYEIIKPLLTGKRNAKKDVEKISKQYDVSVATIYRWIQDYNKTGTISSLVPNFKRRGGPKKNRLSKEDETIIKSVLDEYYLNKQKYSIPYIYRIIQEKFHNAELKPPHINTIRKRIDNIGSKEVTRQRDGETVSDTFGMPGTNPRGKFPLELVQVDHTPLDLILVDEEDREPIGRAYLTLGIDVFSRMVMGFYISYEPVSFFNTGQCILNMIMPKDDFLKQQGVKGEWPIYGLPREISTDNAGEFRGLDLTRFCEQYSIEIDWRPVGRSFYGANVERVFKTLSSQVHNLTGTTFSDIVKKGKYNSEKASAMTICEFEQWFTELIVNIYHKTVHSVIGMTPEEKYMEGIFGLGDYPGTGLPPIIENTKALRYSLLPSLERTVQKTGITIDHVTYFSEVLRKWIVPQAAAKKGKSKLFICKRDPRDISKIYFYDPDIKKYFEVPYRNITNPKINLSELRETIAKIKADKGEVYSLDETTLFETYRRMREIEENSKVLTKKARRKKSSKRHLNKKLEHEKKLEKQENKNDTKEKEKQIKESLNISVPELFSFDLIEEDE
ncbi:helix-turn-helix domain-containing protein [Malaciobacter sp. WC5094]